MNIEKQIIKRINTLRMLGNEVKEINISPYENRMLGGIKTLQGVKLNVVKPNEEQLDCFARKEKEDGVECTALNEMYCKKEKCRFYRNDIKRSEIERSIRLYAQKHAKN